MSARFRRAPDVELVKDAGAEVVYAPGLRLLDDIARVVREVEAPVNVLALSGGPSVAELASVPKVTPKLAQRLHEYFHPPEPSEPADRLPDTGVVHVDAGGEVNDE